MTNNELPQTVEAHQERPNEEVKKPDLVTLINKAVEFPELYTAADMARETDAYVDLLRQREGI